MESTKIQRPLSPHLTIYQPQLTSVLSIVHRGTGILLVAFYLGFFVWSDLSYAFGLSYYVYIGSCLFSQFAIFIQLVVFSCISYHFFNGLRHFLWDSGFFLDLKSVYSTGYSVIGRTLFFIGVFHLVSSNSVPVFRG